MKKSLEAPPFKVGDRVRFFWEPNRSGVWSWKIAAGLAGAYSYRVLVPDEPCRPLITLRSAEAAGWIASATSRSARRT
jgi:hypothetical protein